MDDKVPVPPAGEGIEHDPQSQQESDHGNSPGHNSAFIDSPPPINPLTKPAPVLQRAFTHESGLSTVSFVRSTQDDPALSPRELLEKRTKDKIESTVYELGTGSQPSTSDPDPNPNPNPPTLNKRRRLAWWLDPRRLVFILAPLFLCLLAALIAIAVLYKTTSDTSNTGENITITISAVAATLPLADTAVGAASIIYGVDIQTDGSNKTILAFNSGGKLCIRNFSNETWSENVQCVSGTNMKAKSPIAVLDWIGGPSVYFINNNNFLSGIDFVPQEEGGGWKLSSLAAQKRQANSKSQLAAVTWDAGYSSWLYYQDIDNQLREFGIDDYRDLRWRDGAIGELGICLEGSSIGAARYTIDAKEYLEVYTQTSNDAIHGRLYADSIWTSNIFSVDSTDTTLPGNAGLTATTVFQHDQEIIVLAYVSNDQYLSVQTRNTINVTAYNGFSSPVKILQGDGTFQTGIAATGSFGSTNIYFEVSNKIMFLSTGNVSAAASSWNSINLNSV